MRGPLDPTSAFAAALAARWPDLGLPAAALTTALGPALRQAADLRLAPGAELHPDDASGVIFVIEGELELRVTEPEGAAVLRRVRAPALLAGGDEGGARWVAWTPARLRALGAGPAEAALADPGPLGHALRRLLSRALSEGLLELNLRLGDAPPAEARDRGHLDAAPGS